MQYTEVENYQFQDDDLFDTHKAKKRKRFWCLCVLFVCTVISFISIPLIAVLVNVIPPVKSKDPLKRAQRLAAEVPMIDGHSDLPYRIRTFLQKNITFDLSKKLSDEQREYYKKYGQDLHTDIPRLREGKMGAHFWISWAQCEFVNPLVNVWEQIDLVKSLVLDYNKDLAFAKTSHQVEHLFHDGKLVTLIGIEGGTAIMNSLDVLREFYRAGVRYMTLTHNCHTDWAESCCDPNPPKQKGLSEFGKQVVKEMNKLGMIIDLSHTSIQTMKDTISTSAVPVIFSHSNVYELCKHQRNVPDDVLELIKQNKGLIMVNFVPIFVSEDERVKYQELEMKHKNDSEALNKEMAEWRKANPTKIATLEKVVEHIDYIVKKIGIDHVGIGSDFEGFYFTTQGLEDVSKPIHLMAELLKKGYSDEDVKKIMGLNLLRVFEAVEDYAKSHQ